MWPFGRARVRQRREWAVLYVLNRDGPVPMRGKMIAERAKRLGVSFGWTGVYAFLADMEDDGLIFAEESVATWLDGGRIMPRVYSITPLGAARLSRRSAQ